MLFRKTKLLIIVDHGRGAVLTPPLRGMIDHLIVKPQKMDIIYDFKIFDDEGDDILHSKNVVGRLDVHPELVVGKTVSEELMLAVENSRDKRIVSRLISKMKKVEDRISFDVILLTRER